MRQMPASLADYALRPYIRQNVWMRHWGLARCGGATIRLCDQPPTFVRDSTAPLRAGRAERRIIYRVSAERRQHNLRSDHRVSRADAQLELNTVHQPSGKCKKKNGRPALTPYAKQLKLRRRFVAYRGVCHIPRHSGPGDRSVAARLESAQADGDSECDHDAERRAWLYAGSRYVGHR